MPQMPHVDVPALDHDAQMLKEFGYRVTPRGRRERRVFAALCAYLAAGGWTPKVADSGESEEQVTDTKSAMEIVFNLDECWVTFSKMIGGMENQHSVYIVLGNDLDIVSDWRYHRDDVDGFNALMEKFDPEQFA